jgi:glycosyltransferase involved in cell wall biosynthesis
MASRQTGSFEQASAETTVTTVSARPLVSVIIPTRNRAALLERALDSIFSQWGLGTDFDVEAIVVDDDSTDSTASVLAEFPQVRHLRLSTQQGASAARNAGIKASRGKFVCFLDDDDVWLPGRLRLQIPVLERHPEAGAVYSQVFNTNTGKAFPSSSRAASGRIHEALLSGNFMCIHSVLIRREALDKAGYFDESLSSYEDWDLWLRLSFHYSFVFAPGLVAVYLVAARGLWQTGTRAKENTERVIEKALRMLPDSPDYVELKRTARARLALEYSQAWTQVLEALRMYPFLVRYDWARQRVARWMRKLALKSGSPLCSLEELCSEVKEAAKSDPGIRNSWWMRQTVAKSWAETASYLAVRPAQEREALYAAARATALAPTLLFRGALGLIMIRGAIVFCVTCARSAKATWIRN